ncbi:hypothetical protein [Gellertiella hungarica]|uniref:Transmembrane protein n=1 Tax=Gellertiella hungarica TaxID=1572859 RepID=A0A7W6J9C8_9HYPH|nr:hypothetical protein [Gellertiella hungarica]MBB4067211.1 hypothetical protein [Gellertiella hungarica]
MTLPVSQYGSDPTIESSSSAVYWGPVIAGALAASVLTALLMLVGSGLGLTMVSPFSGESASLTTIGISAAIWFVVVQWLSSGVGGYLTGRLRTKWSGIHTDEVYFRDTAHGFLAWAVATLLMLAMASSTASGLLQKGATFAGAAVGTAAGSAAAIGADAADDSNANPVDYFTDMLMRPADPARAAATDTAASNREIGRILIRSAAEGEMTPDDRAYLDRVVAARTGLSEADAKARIDTVLKQAEDAKVKAQQTADEARKGAATAALLGALALFIGAFIAGAAAAVGGRQRDEDESRYGS